MTRLLLIDADDGPDCGGAAALGRCARALGIAHETIAFEALASGIAELAAGGPVRILDRDGLRDRLAEVAADELVVPCSRRALAVLASIREEGGELPRALVALLASERLPDFSAAEDGNRAFGAGARLDLAGGRFCRRAPARAAALAELEAGLILTPRDRILIVADAEEAWYRLRALERAGDWPCFFVAGRGRRLHAACGLVAGGRSCAQVVLRVDAPRESWRLAFGRTVAGPIWERATAELAAELGHDGFVESLWLLGPASRRAELVAWRPLPSSYIDLASALLVGALAGDRRGLVPAGLVHADVPVDRAVTAAELKQRSFRT